MTATPRWEILRCSLRLPSIPGGPFKHRVQLQHHSTSKMMMVTTMVQHLQPSLDSRCVDVHAESIRAHT